MNKQQRHLSLVKLSTLIQMFTLPHTPLLASSSSLLSTPLNPSTASTTSNPRGSQALPLPPPRLYIRM